MGRTLLILLAVLIYVIASIHLLAHWLFLYWTYSWLDSVMHTLAGLWIGLFVLWLVYHSPYGAWVARMRERAVGGTRRMGDFPLVLGSAFVFGVLWELYQVAGHLIFSIPFKPDHLADSVSDVLFGMLGAVFALAVYRAFTKERTSEHKHGEKEQVDSNT